MRIAMSNRKYDAILYDLDGTLFDSVPVIVDSFIKTYEEILYYTDNRSHAHLLRSLRGK